MPMVTERSSCLSTTARGCISETVQPSILLPGINLVKTASLGRLTMAMRVPVPTMTPLTAMSGARTGGGAITTAGGATKTGAGGGGGGGRRVGEKSGLDRVASKAAGLSLSAARVAEAIAENAHRTIAQPSAAALGPVELGWFALRLMPSLDHALLQERNCKPRDKLGRNARANRAKTGTPPKIDRQRGAVMPQTEPDSIDYGRHAIYPLSGFDTVLALSWGATIIRLGGACPYRRSDSINEETRCLTNRTILKPHRADRSIWKRGAVPSSRPPVSAEPMRPSSAPRPAPPMLPPRISTSRSSTSH